MKNVAKIHGMLFSCHVEFINNKLKFYTVVEISLFTKSTVKYRRFFARASKTNKQKHGGQFRNNIEYYLEKYKYIRRLNPKRAKHIKSICVQQNVSI